ncbi:MAG TPA: LLM class flavin-dependent oxidoreductase [Paracoccaceae bacterium]|nr:LLM class flavin-dependent oxidoreductase [Paracoccaceae bacterium]
MIPFSVLDLSPIPEGGTAADALANTLDLARHAEAIGASRYWLAEHHNMPGLACSSTAVLIGQVAAATSRIRVGSGGIMLPNHAPLVVAEQFGTLATLFPGRIELGLGRAPGTDMATARALRRGKTAEDGSEFPRDVMELMSYLEPGAEARQVRAIPGAGTEVPVWILGSSLFGAQLAAHLGLPYAFASHFAPAALEQAAEVYRETFRPSGRLDRPRFMMAVNCFAADDDATGFRLATSQAQAFANLRRGRPGPLPRPVDDLASVLAPAEIAMASEALSVSAAGGPATVRESFAALIERHRPDELILAAAIHDPAARRRSLSVAAEQLAALAPARAAE